MSEQGPDTPPVVVVEPSETEKETALALVPPPQGGSLANYIPSDDELDTAVRLATQLCKATAVPQSMRNKPADVLLAILHGAAVGWQAPQALQNICVINGKTSVYGDGGRALLQQHPDFEYLKEIAPHEIETFGQCTVKRKGQEPVTRQFSIDDAKLANLWGKAGPWTQYPKRMLQWRAFWWAVRDCMADALMGLYPFEEAQDIPVRVINPRPAEPAPGQEPEPAAGGNGGERPTVNDNQLTLIQTLFDEMPREGAFTETRDIVTLANHYLDREIEAIADVYHGAECNTLCQRFKQHKVKMVRANEVMAAYQHLDAAADAALEQGYIPRGAPPMMEFVSKVAGKPVTELMSLSGDMLGSVLESIAARLKLVDTATTQGQQGQ